MDVSPNSIEHLILEGAAEVAGISLETGEMMYTFTPKLQDVNPHLYHEVSSYIYGAVMSIWEKGFLEIDIMSADPLVSPTEKAYDKTVINEQLSDREQNVLENILRVFHKDDTV